MSLPLPTVLVVDDDPMILATLEMLLSEQWNVFTAESAALARDVLRKHEVAVLLADMRMPRETGVDLMAWAVEHTPSTMRILLTGFADYDAVVGAINKGKVWYYLRKPWDNNDLVTLIQRAIEFREKDQQLLKNIQGAIRSLVTALDSSHTYTRGHSARVAWYSHLLCEALQMSREERERVVLAAELHDIGKIGVDNSYLDKNGKLTDQEWANVKNHVSMGERILAQAGFLDPVVPLMAAHHERPDGRGYPRGLVGDQIPLGGRIIALADTFDAMTSDRAYRKGLPTAVALAEIQKHRTTQFFPDLADLFCAIMVEQELPQTVEDVHRRLGRE